jgi:HEAT repeat protein
MPWATDFDSLVENLAIPHRAKKAYRSLLVAGAKAVPALKQGLSHPDPRVRIAVCMILDHSLEEECIPDLRANLTHEDEQVRAWAVHALACDRCKEGSCRPGEGDTMPLAIRMMFEDSSALVRCKAIALVGEAVHRHPDALPALQRALETEPHAGNRKIIRWHVPGGPRYEKTKPKVRASGC